MEIQITVLSVPEKAQNYWQETRLVWRGQRATRIWELAWLCHFFPVSCLPSSSGLWEEKDLPSWRTCPHLSPRSAGFCHISFLIWILPPLRPPLAHSLFLTNTLKVAHPAKCFHSLTHASLLSQLLSAAIPLGRGVDGLHLLIFCCPVLSFFLHILWHNIHTVLHLDFFFKFNGTVRSFLSVH